MRGIIKSIWYVLTLRCEEADRIRSLAQTASPTRVERFGAWSHALVCRGCWIARHQTEQLEKLLDDMRGGEPVTNPQSSDLGLSPERRERLERALQAAEHPEEK